MNTEGQAQVNLFPAVRGFFYLLFGRVPFRFWGVFILFTFSTLILITTNQIAPIIKTGFTRLDSSSLPISIKTTHSPAAKSVTEQQLLESEGLVKTPQGILPFSRMLTVYSTSYDKNCSGCSKTTASGLPTGYGVVAVDPNIIPLGTKLYIPGYGTAVAGDTGGNIKGTIIDLGFDDVKNGWWSSRFVEIYILK
jgi:3D (Asp-Asp-Asp) domain-containing protein